ncbi:MAG: hypothetical protein F6K28_29190, partial [Microcoleus sp. SIO2G3]|nr:hypothetical protein [Microcoleus sp. SIO2G3]
MDATQTVSAAVQIRPVESSADFDRFLDLPARLYANDPNWVAPIRSSIAKELAPDGPFRKYGQLQAFIAVQENVAVGRIVAAVNQRLIDREGQSIGVFGYFECVENFAIAQALLNAACDWLRSQGMTRVRGPINLSTHNSCLFLAEGFDSPPMLLMPYNPPCYPRFLVQDGWEKAKDAYAYKLLLDRSLPPEFEKGYRIASKSGVQFRPLNLKGEAFTADVRAIYDLFDKSFVNNWSYAPRTFEEFIEEARSLQSLVDPQIFWLAEYEGDLIGLFMCLPDYNIVLKRVGGKLDWLGILKFLWYRRQIDRARVITIAALPEHRRRMVPLALIHLGM